MTLPSLLEAPMSQLISFLGTLDAAGLTEETMNAITADPDMANDWLQALFDANPRHFFWLHLELPEELPDYECRIYLQKLAHPDHDDAVLDYYCQPDNFRRIVAPLTPEQVTLLCLEMKLYKVLTHYVPLSSKARAEQERTLHGDMRRAIEFDIAARERAADPSWRDWPIDVLECSSRTTTSLTYQEITTVGQLCEYTENELLLIPNFGLPCLEEVNARLDCHGLRLRSRD